MALIKFFVRFPAIFATAFLVFYIAFSMRQSAVLAFVLGFLYYRLKTLRGSQQHFRPYCVVVEPNWSELLLDSKLVKDAEECEQIDRILGQTLDICFTVLKSDLDLDFSAPALIYSNNGNYFVSSVDFSEPIKGIQFTHFEHPLERKRESVPVIRAEDAIEEDPLHVVAQGRTWHFRPEICFRWGVDGYELGLVVCTEWWKRISATEDAKDFAVMDAGTDRRTGETRLKLATFPYPEFYFWSELEELYGLNKISNMPLTLGTILEKLEIALHDSVFKQERIERKLENYRLEHLAEHRWTVVERDPNSEIRDSWVRVRHKYFTVRHRHI